MSLWMVLRATDDVAGGIQKGANVIVILLIGFGIWASREDWAVAPESLISAGVLLFAISSVASFHRMRVKAYDLEHPAVDEGELNRLIHDARILAGKFEFPEHYGASEMDLSPIFQEQARWLERAYGLLPPVLYHPLRTAGRLDNYPDEAPDSGYFQAQMERRADWLEEINPVDPLSVLGPSRPQSP